MDYGYQLLKHVFAQVFGNLGSAARITLVLLAIPVLIFAVSIPGVLSGEAFSGTVNLNAPEASGLNIFGLLVGIIVGIVCWLWAAVAWHRFVLLEEYPSGVFPTWRGSNIGNYFGNGLLIGLIVIGVMFGLMLVIGILVAVFQSATVALVLGVGLIFGVSWIATRIGLILPAAAIGEKLRISESWKATAPVSGQIILPIIVIALASTILNQGIIAVFGETETLATPFGDQQQVTLSPVGWVISIALGWIQMLVNLALMTTLYGNLIEGRQLN